MQKPNHKFSYIFSMELKINLRLAQIKFRKHCESQILVQEICNSSCQCTVFLPLDVAFLYFSQSRPIPRLESTLPRQHNSHLYMDFLQQNK